MYDQAFTRTTLKYCLTQDDFRKNTKLNNQAYKDKIIDRAYNRAEKGFSKKTKIVTSIRKGKPTYKFNSLSNEIVIRKIGQNLKRITKVKQENRDKIMANIISMVAEPLPYIIIRTDIKSFYESINIEKLLDKTNNIQILSNQSRKLLYSFFKMLSYKNIQGIPRGMGISAVLSEFVLEHFDQAISKHDDVFYYSRFVDDIFILLDHNAISKTILNYIKDKLPYGLELNLKKTKMYKIKKIQSSSIPEQINEIEFLGYRIHISNHNCSDNGKLTVKRRIDIGIANNKILRIKTRIVRSILSYNKNKDFNLLKNRVHVLTSNYSVFDRKLEYKRKTGIYYNYTLLSVSKYSDLNELDVFLRRIILAGREKVSIELNKHITTKEKRKLLNYTFRNGFKERRFCNFSADQLTKIMECWKYE